MFYKEKIKQARIRDFIFLLLALYYAQGTLYAQGSAISQIVFALILLISGGYLIKTVFLKLNKPLFYKVWSALLLINIFGMVFTGEISNSHHFSMFKGILITSLLFYPFYYFSIQNLLQPKHLTRFLIIMVPLFVFQYYLNSSAILTERMSNKTEVVNNTSYFFVGLMPYVFFIRKKIIGFFIMLILMFFIIQSAKRGAIISGGIGLLTFAYFHLRTINKRNRLKGFALILLALIAIGYYVYNLFNENQYVVMRMQSIADGSFSGRDTIYANIFNSWMVSDSFINLFFGYGYAASLHLSGTGNFAHNDWLELLSNFGLLGITVFILLFLSAFQKTFSNRLELDTKIVLIAVLLIMVLNTIVYRFYSAGDGFLYSIILGYIFGVKSIKTNYPCRDTNPLGETLQPSLAHQ